MQRPDRSVFSVPASIAGRSLSFSTAMNHQTYPARVSLSFLPSHTHAKADQENLDWVVVSAGPVLRLHPVGTGVGTGRRSRTETFAEIHLDLVGPTDAAYLWLLFSADALKKQGVVEELLSNSVRYAAELGARLRDRVYNEVVPDLALGILSARGLKGPTPEDLAESYQMTLIYLFRLLFLAYAEDKELLPYKHNTLYRDRSLKHKAQELVQLKHDATAFATGTALWEEFDHLFKAVDKGNTTWGVPAYNGGLFSRDAIVSMPPTGLSVRSRGQSRSKTRSCSAVRSLAAASTASI